MDRLARCRPAAGARWCAAAARGPGPGGRRGGRGMRAVPSTAALERFRALLAARFGLRLEPSQQQWLAEVFDRRRGAGSEAEYLAALELRPTQAETDALVAELTVGETFFFRNSEKFDALRLTVLPALMRARESRGERRLSLLSAGCASGEEG